MNRLYKLMPECLIMQCLYHFSMRLLMEKTRIENLLGVKKGAMFDSAAIGGTCGFLFPGKVRRGGEK